MTRGRSAFSYMTDMASPGAGASVVMATCSDERHPPHDALDEDEQRGTEFRLRSTLRASVFTMVPRGDFFIVF